MGLWAGGVSAKYIGYGRHLRQFVRSKPMVVVDEDVTLPGAVMVENRKMGPPGWTRPVRC